MNTKLREGSRRLRICLVLGALAVAVACSSNTHVSCSPTLTCSLRPERFAPPAVDGGLTDCDEHTRCPVAQLSLGARHACALTDAKNLLCWGDDSEGQRGQSSTDDASGDAGVDAGGYWSIFSRVVDDVTQVSAGEEHTCVLLEAGDIKCWGSDREGQVDGRISSELVREPTRIALERVKQVSAGARHTCGLTDDGVVCWGSNIYGQGGRPSRDASAGPMLIPQTAGATELDCGVRHCCARSDSAVFCWGELIDAAGQPYVSEQPIQIEGLENVLQISAGAGHSCALTAERIACWGRNEQGQLGDGTTQASARPVTVVEVAAGAGYVAAGGGEIDGELVGHSCAVDRASQVSCWGHNSHGQLGRVKSDDRPVPQSVQAFRQSGDGPLDQIARVEVGALFSCALSSRGSVYCWGSNDQGQLGINANVGAPGRTPMPGELVRVPHFGRAR